jgi:hypothetical protein
MCRTVPLYIIRSLLLYIQQCHTGLVTACEQDQDGRPDPARKLLTNPYDIYHHCVYSEKLLMMDRGTDRNVYSFIPKINLRSKCT